MMMGISGMVGISGMSGLLRMSRLTQERQTDIKCHTFSELQARADLKMGISGLVGMSGMLTISGNSGQTLSVIPFWNHKLELS